MLTQVTSPGASPDIRTYHYESGDSTLLTGISINGVRYSRYQYFADRRVSVSELTSGEERDQFSYGVNQTTLTDIRGQSTIYQYTRAYGPPKITDISRNGTATCSAASAHTTYDANGYVSSKRDWNGNDTVYVYDNAGRLLNTTNTDGMTVLNTWNWDKLLQAEYLDSNGIRYAQAAYSYDWVTGRPQSEIWTDFKTNTTRETRYAYTLHADGGIASKSITRVLPQGLATTTLTYDTRGNLITRTNPLAQQEAWTDYDVMGHAGKWVDLNGVSTTYQYDEKGLLAAATRLCCTKPRACSGRTEARVN